MADCLALNGSCGNDSEVGLSCAEHDPYSTVRFVLIMMASAVACIGIVTNSLLLSIFLRLTRAEPSINMSRLYLMLLSFCDICFCVSFFAVFGLDALALYLHSTITFYLYFDLLVFVFTLSRIVQMAIPYVIIVATFERWLLSSSRSCNLYVRRVTDDRTRVVICCAIVATALAIRLPCGWAYFVKEYNCSSDVFGTLQLYPTSLVEDSVYNFVQFYVVNALGVFVPFVVLISLNLAIMSNIKAQRNMPGNMKSGFVYHFLRIFHRRSSLPPVGSLRIEQHLSPENKADKKRKAQLQATVITMMVVVTSYILCNTPHFIMTILEQFFASVLTDENGASTALYLASADVVSALFMFSSFLRLFIFSKCNPQVREELGKICGLKQKTEPQEQIEVAEKLLNTDQSSSYVDDSKHTDEYL